MKRLHEKAANLWWPTGALFTFNMFKLNESCKRTLIFVNISLSLYSCTSWKLMPNDLGQPRNGKIRNSCRVEHDISEYKSKRAMFRVRTAAEIKVNSEPIKVTELKDKRLL